MQASDRGRLTTAVALPIASLSVFKERFIVELSYVLSRFVTSVPMEAKLIAKAGSTRAMAPNETAANSFGMRVTLEEGYAKQVADTGFGSRSPDALFRWFDPRQAGAPTKARCCAEAGRASTVPG